MNTIVRMRFERATQDHKAQYGADPAEPGRPRPPIAMIRLAWEAWEDIGRPPEIDVIVQPVNKRS